MKQTVSKFLAFAMTLALIVSFLPGQAQSVRAAPIPLTLGGTYTQNFDSLANSGTPAWTNDSTLEGWYLGTDANPAVTTYLVGTGSGTTGAFYSFGSASATDRALGGLGSNSYYGASGVGKGYIGLILQNQTGANISALSVSYTGEEWRNGGNTSIQSLTFSYVISSSLPALTTSGTAFPALDFAGPIHTSTAGALDGNAAASRTALASTITGIIVPDGSYILLRWTDLNDSGNDHGLAIDDLSVSASTLPVDAAPSILSTVPANGATDVPVNSNISITFSEAVNVTDPWFSLSCVTSGSHAATVTGGPTTFTIDPGADFVMGEACTVTVYAAKVTDQDSNDPPDNMTVDFTAGYTTVFPPLPIGTVNGLVPDSDSCTAHVSPYAGQTVTVQGVIYEKTLQAISNSTNTYKGFFIQSTADTTDGEPDTSDGLFVFMSTASQIGTYIPMVGDEIVLKGKVSEFFNMTELVSPLTVMSVLRNGVDIEAEVPPVVANPPVSLADANCYWERLQGMRMQVPQDSVVLGGRNVFSPADAEVWLARPDSTIAQRANPYARKAFRDAHPLDDNYDPTNWDGNGYRILMGSLGIKANASDAQELIDPARSYDTVTNGPAGGLNYTFSKYRIEISEQPAFSEGVDPAANNPPQIFDRSTHYTVADYNLENLYDYRDNPFSGCDFANIPAGSNPRCPNTGTPFLSSVTPPYDYVPADDAAYQARLNDIALEIINDLHSPDVLMAQEVENQDICSVVDGAFTCGTTDNADGKPDVLQELALKIATNGGPAYNAAFDRNSSDLRGIAPAFLYRTDRVELLPPEGDPVLGGTPAIDGYTAVPYDSDVSNPKTLNALLPAGITACETSWVFPRAPDIGLFRIYSTGIGAGSYRDVYVINNHFKSGPDTCVDHRREQAKYNAALVAFIQISNPNARIVMGGDLNVYPRPDDIALGASDQLGALYDPGLGLKNLWEVLLGQAPESAYSYVFVGMAQTLDQMFVNPPMLTDLNQYRIVHINSDFPADYPGDVARGTSDHDPNAANFLFSLPPKVVVPIISPEPSTEGGSVTASAAFTDPDGSLDGPFTCALNYGDGSGDVAGVVSGSTCTGAGHAYSTFGVYNVTVYITDRFGVTGSNSASHVVIFNWSGFFPPVDNLPAWNSNKAGSAIPLKFSLGGDKGMNIFADGYPQSVQIACDTGEVLGTPLPIANPGGSSMSYGGGKYNDVWKTEKSWSGTCRQLIVKLIDSTEHLANFQFK
jgi:predicted extracellular nuclease